MNDFESIVIKHLPLIDVRSPNEYKKGAFPNSINLPLIGDTERQLIGICYKENEPEAALELGYTLVSGAKRDSRIKTWINRINHFPNSIIYCFRGGMRSKITQEWIKEKSFIEIPYIDGGYKAFRSFLLSKLRPSTIKSEVVLLGGYTGGGKTKLLNHFNNFIDLEKIANHRGSSFGEHLKPQPSQINFENKLSYELILHQNKHYQYLLLEDEGRHIGKNYLPKPLSNLFNQGYLVLLNTSLEERLINTLEEYVISSQIEYKSHYSEELGLKKWYEYITSSITKIHKRLGNERYHQILKYLEIAFNKQLNAYDFTDHIAWIKILLQEYYDPMYEFQIKNTNKKIVFQGNYQAVYDYINNYYYK